MLAGGACLHFYEYLIRQMLTRNQNDREERREESARVEGVSSRYRDTVPDGCTKSLTTHII